MKFPSAIKQDARRLPVIQHLQRSCVLGHSVIRCSRDKQRKTLVI